MVVTHLISKKDFDCEASGSRRNIFDSDGVIGIGNDVKINILFLIADNISFTLDSNTDVTWKNTNMRNTVCNSHMKKQWFWWMQSICFTFSSFCAVHGEVCRLVSFQSASLQPWTKHFDFVRVASLSNIHLME